MKKTKLPSFFHLFTISFLLLFYSSCDIKSPVEDVNIIFNAKPITTIIAGDFVDANTGMPITKNITLTIQGAGRSGIADLTGEIKSSFTTKNGFVSFALTEDIRPAQESPARIILIAKASGYKTNSMPIDITHTGSVNFSIPMLPEGGPLPEGIVTGNGPVKTNNQGVTTAPSTLNITESSSGISSSVYIPSGVKVTDKNGNALTGSLTAAMTYYSPVSGEAIKYFPGGFNVYTNTNGLQEQTTFITAGVAEITLKDGSGKEARYFQTAASKHKADSDSTLPLITIEIPSNAVNPETGQQIKEGDEIDLWSMLPDSAEWNWEKKYVIQYNKATGKYFVTFQTNHLTLWNFDWKGYQCYIGGSIRFTGIPNSYPLKVTLSGGIGQFYYEGVITDGNLSFNRPPNFPVTARVYDNNTMQLLGEKVLDLCNMGNIEWPLNITPPTPPVAVIVNAEGWCPCQPDVLIRPNGNPVWYQNITLGWTFWIYAGKIEDGQITIPGILSTHDYRYGTWYEGEWYEVAARVYEDHAEINGNLSTSNIVQAYSKGNNIIYFKGQLSDQICNQLCTQSK
jgi:hypothetical protein